MPAVKRSKKKIQQDATERILRRHGCGTDLL